MVSSWNLGGIMNSRWDKNYLEVFLLTRVFSYGGEVVWPTVNGFPLSLKGIIAGRTNQNGLRILYPNIILREKNAYA